MRPGGRSRPYAVQRDLHHCPFGSFGRPAVAGAEVDVGPADLVEEDRGRLDRVAPAERAVGFAVAQEALEGVGERASRPDLRARRIVLVEDAVALGLERDQDLEVPFGDGADRTERLLEPVARTAGRRQGRPQSVAVFGGRRPSERREDAFAREPAAVQRHAGYPRLLGDALQRRPLCTVPLERAPRSLQDLDVSAPAHSTVTAVYIFCNVVLHSRNMTVPTPEDASHARGDPAPFGGRTWLVGPFVLAFLAALFGTYWDDAWHTERGRDSFFIAPHVTLYAGIALTGAVSFAWAAFVARERGVRAALSYPPLTIAAVGVATTLVAGPIDNVWHELFGRDSVIWSPPHMLGVAGVIAAAAAFVLETCRIPGRRGRLLAAVAGAALLAACAVTVLEYETDVPQFDEIWYLPVLAAAAALALGLVRSNSDQRWAATAAAAAYTLILVAFRIALGSAELPGPAIPALIVPAMALDLAHRRLAPLPAAATFTGALYAAYLPYLNFLRDDVRLDALDVVLGAPLALAASYLALRALSPGTPRSPVAPAAGAATALVATALLLPAAAFAHDPGQGTEIAKADVTATASGYRLALDARLRPAGGCRTLAPVALVARRAGETLRAPLANPSPCTYRGELDVPARGRWFVYAELRRDDGRVVETWLPIVAATDSRRHDPARSVYLAAGAGADATKTIAGVAMYGVVVALLVGVVALNRRARRG